MLDAALSGWRLQTREADAEETRPPEAELRALRQCIRKLPEHGRLLVDAFYFKSESAEAIGARLGKKGGAIRMMLLRLRSLLGECIQSRLSGSE